MVILMIDLLLDTSALSTSESALWKVPAETMMCRSLRLAQTPPGPPPRLHR